MRQLLIQAFGCSTKGARAASDYGQYWVLLHLSATVALMDTSALECLVQTVRVVPPTCRQQRDSSQVMQTVSLPGGAVWSKVLLIASWCQPVS
jgi:hypothetical protein